MTPTAPPSWRAKFLGRKGLHRADVERGDDEPQTRAADGEPQGQQPERRRTGSQCEQQARYRETCQASGHHVPRRRPIGEAPRDRDRHGEHQSGDEQQVAGLCGRIAGDVLDKHRYEIGRPEQSHSIREADHRGGAEAAAREQAKRQQRRAGAHLPADERQTQRERGHRGDEGGRRQPPRAVSHDRQIEQRDEPGRQQRGAWPIERSPRTCASRVGKRAHAERPRGQAERDRKQKDRSPAEGLHQQAADRRPDGRREHDAEAEQPHGPATLFRGEDLEQRDHRQRLHDAGGGALQHPRRDHRLGAPTRRAQDRAGEKHGHGREKRAALPEGFDQPSRREHRRGRRRQEPGGDPLQRIMADVEFAQQRRERHVDDGRGEDRGDRADHRGRDHPRPALEGSGQGGQAGRAEAGSPTTASGRPQSESAASASSAQTLPRPIPLASASSRASLMSNGRSVAGSTRRAARPPDTRGTDRRRDRRSGSARRKHRGKRVQIFAELPEQKRHALARGFERGEDAQGARGVAGEPCFGELEDVEARDIGDRALDRIVLELSFGQEQTELLDLLFRCEQIALGRLGEKLQGVLGDALTLAREALAKPSRQLVALEWIHGDADAPLFERREPRRSLCGAIEPRQRDQREGVGARIRSAILEHARAFDAGLAGWDRKVDQLAPTEQGEVAVGGGERLPLEARLGDQDLALVEPRCARRSADLVARFDRQQRLVAVNDVQGTKSVGEMGGELAGTELHYATGFFADCSRRTIWTTASSCISRQSRCSCASLASASVSLYV